MHIALHRFGVVEGILIAARDEAEEAAAAAESGGGAVDDVDGGATFSDEGECSLCTVTFYANLAHSLTRSP